MSRWKRLIQSAKDIGVQEGRLFSFLEQPVTGLKKVTPNPPFVLAHSPGRNGFSLVTEETLKKGDEVLRVPKALWSQFSAKKAEEKAKAAAPEWLGHVEDVISEFGVNKTGTKRLKEVVLLATQILLHIGETDDTAFTSPYMQVVGKAVDARRFPIFWTKENLLELSGSVALSNAVNRLHFYSSLHSRIFSSDFGMSSSVSLPQFLWAIGIVSSRATSSSVMNSNSKILGLNTETPFTLVPVLDFLNHSVVQNTHKSDGVCSMYFDNASKDFVVTVDEDTASGSPLEISYGNLSNSELLKLYGFTTLDNPNDSVTVPIVWPELNVVDHPTWLTDAKTKLLTEIDESLLCSDKTVDPNMVLTRLNESSIIPDAIIYRMRLLLLEPQHLNSVVNETNTNEEYDMSQALRSAILDDNPNPNNKKNLKNPFDGLHSAARSKLREHIETVLSGYPREDTKEGRFELSGSLLADEEKLEKISKVNLGNVPSIEDRIKQDCLQLRIGEKKILHSALAQLYTR